MAVRTALLFLAWSSLRGADIAAGRADLPGLEPAVAAAARWAVAIQVEREAEPSALPRRGLRPGKRVPADLVEYYKRPPGPASGLLLDREGHVLTSYYNVSGKVKSIEVLLPGGARRSARLLASDRSDDLALLRVEDPPAELDVPPVKWAEAGELKVGKLVIVLGRSPDPAHPTATFGIVSAVGRNGGRAFQTDAELNYGNVGGPITDLDGRVVGLAGFVGHRYPLWGLNSGIGFGTNSRTIQEVLPLLLRGESVPPPDRAFLGVGPSERPAPGNQGVLLGRVERDSPADRAGLLPGDVVLSFDGEALEDFLDLRNRIGRHRPGEVAVLKVRRGSDELELKVRLGKRTE